MCIRDRSAPECEKQTALEPARALCRPFGGSEKTQPYHHGGYTEASVQIEWSPHLPLGRSLYRRLSKEPTASRMAPSVMHTKRTGPSSAQSARNFSSRSLPCRSCRVLRTHQPRPKRVREVRALSDRKTKHYSVGEDNTHRLVDRTRRWVVQHAAPRRGCFRSTRKKASTLQRNGNAR